MVDHDGRPRKRADVARVDETYPKIYGDRISLPWWVCI